MQSSLDHMAADEPSQARARELLVRPAILDAARPGKSFRPVEGNTGDRAADAFVLADYLAVFNYATGKTVKTIGLARAGFGGTDPYTVTGLWSGAQSTARGTISIPLEGFQGTILRLSR